MRPGEQRPLIRISAFFNYIVNVIGMGDSKSLFQTILQVILIRQKNPQAVM